jgi:hypothetical protein
VIFFPTRNPVQVENWSTSLLPWYKSFYTSPACPNKKNTIESWYQYSANILSNNCKFNWDKIWGIPGLFLTIMHRNYFQKMILFLCLRNSFVAVFWENCSQDCLTAHLRLKFLIAVGNPWNCFHIHPSRNTFDNFRYAHLRQAEFFYI